LECIVWLLLRTSSLEYLPPLDRPGTGTGLMLFLPIAVPSVSQILGIRGLLQVVQESSNVDRLNRGVFFVCVYQISNIVFRGVSDLFGILGRGEFVFWIA